MNKNKFVLILISVLCLFILIAAGIAIYFVANSGKQIIHVDIDHGTESNIEFNNLGLAPGESTDYVIKVKAKESGEYTLLFDFKLNSDTGLKDYVIVKVCCDDVVLYNNTLSQAFIDQSFTYSSNFNSKKSKDIEVTYYMPADVDNQAKGTESIFELNITTTKDGLYE